MGQTELWILKILLCIESVQNKFLGNLLQLSKVTAAEMLRLGGGGGGEKPFVCQMDRLGEKAL